MLSLDSAEWSTLPTAYGTAEGVPALFQRCLKDEELWEELYNVVCHQGTPYGSVRALAPHLVHGLGAFGHQGFYTALGILAAERRYAPVEEAHDALTEPYQSAMDELRVNLINVVCSRREALTREWSLLDEESRAYERANLLADVCVCVLGPSPASDITLLVMSESETYALCPHCNELLRIWLTAKGPEVTSVDGTRWISGKPTPESLMPDASQLSEGEKLLDKGAALEDSRDALLAMAALASRDFEDDELAHKLLAATASIPCPGCGASLRPIEDIGEEP